MHICTYARMHVRTHAHMHIRTHARKCKNKEATNRRKKRRTQARTHLEAETPEGGEDVEAGVGEVDAQDDHGQVEVPC